MFRVANCANAIRPTATIQLTTMEFVIGKLKGRAISTALAERPCSSVFGGRASAEMASISLRQAAMPRLLPS